MLLKLHAFNLVKLKGTFSQLYRIKLTINQQTELLEVLDNARNKYERWGLLWDESTYLPSFSL